MNKLITIRQKGITKYLKNVNVVDLIITEMGVMEVTEKGLVLKEKNS